MLTLLQDSRFAARSLRKRPGYTILAVLVLALAIGANTTVFSLLNGYLLRPLPYPDDARLVGIYNTYPGLGLEIAGTSVPDYLDRRARATSLESIAIYTADGLALGGDGRPERALVVRASPSLFDVLGIAPQLGRPFGEDEATIGKDRVAVLSHTTWMSRFGGRDDVLERDVELDGERFRVIGVMPEGFGFPDRNVAVWVPFAFTPAQTSDTERGMEFSQSIGRLRTGASIEGLNAELDAIVRANIEAGLLGDEIETTRFTGRAVSLRDMTVGDLEQMLFVLQGIVLAVLLIACANLANLQLARMAGRRRELAVRAALGADTQRLGRLVVAESLVLAATGAVCGLLVASGGLELVRALGLDGSSRGFEFALDANVLAFTACSTIVAALASALLPLVALLREDLARAAHEGARSLGGLGAQTFRSALVVVQIAVGVALLAGAGLLAKSFYQLQRAGTGFDAGGLWTARIAVPENRYAGDGAAALFYTRVLEELGALPGVTDVAFTQALPFSGGNFQGSYQIDGYVAADGESPPHANTRVVSPGYFDALGIPVVEGRGFEPEERENVVIVDEVFARRYFPGGAVLGERVRQNDDHEWHTIVGVVPGVKHSSLADELTKETLYWHYRQKPTLYGALALRTTLPPEQLTRAATDAVLRIDPNVPLSDARSMSSRIAASLGPQRTPFVLTLVFAGVAFALAIVGVYGVLTWSVTQRYREIGVRMALGARAGDVASMILRQGGRLTLAGLGIGVVAAFGIGRVLAAQIRDVSPTDPIVFAAAFVGLGATALLASWLPARRATRIDPLVALRHD